MRNQGAQPGMNRLLRHLPRQTGRLAAAAALMLCAPMALGADEPAAAAPASLPPAVTPVGGAPPVAAAAGWVLRLPKDDLVSYKGLARFDNAGASGGPMLYPAPGIIGLLAAVATHGAIVDAQKKAEKERIQAAADAVLAPYQPVLGTYTYRELMQQGLQKSSAAGGKRLLEFAEPKPVEWVIESVPLFFMTADAKALVLDAAIVVYAPASAQAPAFQNVIRVVSHPQGESDLPAYWNANQGERLKEQSVLLFAQALDIAIKDLQNPAGANAPQKTVRYFEGGTQRMERAQVLGEQCDRLLIKTLRGWLMSVPAGPCGSVPNTAAAPK